MRSSKFLSFVLGILSACGLALSAEAEAYSFAVGTEIPLSTDYVTVSPGKIQDDGYTIGSTKATTVITLNLNNTTAGNYYLQWKGGADGLTAEYTATATLDSDSSVIASGDFHQRNTDTGGTGSGWTPVQIAMLPLKNLPAGAFTLKLAFSSTTGGYAGNYGNFKVLSTDSAFMTLPQTSYSPSTASTAGTLFVKNATAKESSIESTHGNTVLDFLVNVSERSTCGMTYFSGADNCSCELNWSLLDLNGIQVWPTSGLAATDAITNSTNWKLTDEHTHDFGTLSAGNYILLATVSNESGTFAGNWGNFTFTATPVVETYYTVTVPTVAHATATVTGATQTETSATETTYSASSNATVTVTYTPEEGYGFDDGVTGVFTKANIAADWTITAPTVKALSVYTVGDVITGTDDSSVHYTAIGSTTGATGHLVVKEGGTYAEAGNMYLVRKDRYGGENARGYLDVYGGSVTVANGVSTGWNAGGIAYVNQYGGSIEITGSYQCARGATNYTTIAGGTFHTTGDLQLCIYGDTLADVTISGGTTKIDGNVKFYQRDDSPSAVARLSLTGGSLITKGIAAGATTQTTPGELLLNGGTLQAKSANTAFIASSSVLTVYLTSGTIDTQTYDVTIPAAISGTSMAFAKTGTGTLTFTGTIPSSGTITVAKKGGKVVLPGNVTSWVGEKTAATYDETAKTTTFTYNATMRTVTVPTLAGATIVVTADGTAVTAESDGKSYKVEDGSTVVVTYTEASDYTLVGGKKVVSLGTILEDTAMPTDSIPKTIADRTFNGDYVTETITGAGRIFTYGNHDANPQLFTTLDCDLTGFTGTIYVKKDTKIGPNFKGAAQAKWVLEGELYLFGTNLEHTVDTACAGTISFGDFGLSAMNRIYMYGGTQDVTIEIGAVNSNMTATLNTGIGGDWWSHTPNDNASVTMKKVGTGKLTTNLLGARKWEIAEGEVNFVPMTSEATAGGKRMYVTNCNEMVVASGAKLSGFYGSLPDSGVGAFTLEKLTVPSGATFAPDLGRTWVVGTATLDGCNLALTDTGKLTHGTKYTLLSATTSVSAANITLTGSTDFEVKVEGNSLVATFTGYGQYVIASGETLTYAGRVQDETKHMDTDLGIIIEAGGKLVVNARAMTLPGTDGTEGNDGTLTLPSVTLPSGSTIKDCVQIISPRGYHGVYFVASDGYGYITFEPGSAVGFTIHLR